MSFFIKRGKQKVTNSKYSKDNSKKRKLNNKIKLNSEEEELTSSSEDEGGEINRNKDAEISDNENETAQEKKLRLAKVYLEEITKREKEKLEYENKDLDGNDNVAKILKEDHLKSIGRLQTQIADKYKGADLNNVKLMKCKNHRGCITCLCLANKFIFTGSKDGTVVKWSLDENKKIDHIPYAKHHVISNKVTGHSKTITALVVSTDGKFLVISDGTRDIQIWNPDTLKHIQTLKGHQDAVTGVVFRKNTHTLYSCSKDRSVKVWSLDEMAYVETLYGHQNQITSIDALSREKAVTSGGMDGTIRVWKIVEESQLIYNGPTDCIDIVKLLNEETFVSGSADGALNVWGVNKKKPLCTYNAAHGCDPLTNQPYWICSIATLTNTDLIASGSQDGCINVWKLGNNFRSLNLIFKIEVLGFINDLSFTEDGNFLIAAVGSEHKLGRWTVIKNVKNSILKIPLIIE